MATDYKFEGWVADDPSSVDGKMVWREYEPKVWEETDVDIKITHSGICGSDIHTLRAGWVCRTLMQRLPLCMFSESQLASVLTVTFRVPPDFLPSSAMRLWV